MLSFGDVDACTGTVAFVHIEQVQGVAAQTPPGAPPGERRRTEATCAIRIARERDQLACELRRSPTAAELAQRLGCAVEDILEAAAAAHARGSDSFDRPLIADDGDDGNNGDDGDDAATLAERLGAEDPGFAAAEATVTLDGLLATLSERDALVVRLRFREDLTQAEIGQRVGCSQMHVSRILRTALSQLTQHAHTAAPRSHRRAGRRPL